MAFFEDVKTPAGTLRPKSGTAVKQTYEFTPKGKTAPTHEVKARGAMDALWKLQMEGVVDFEDIHPRESGVTKL